MKANKDKGTSVGFSKVSPESYDGKRFEGNIADEFAQWDNKSKKLRPIFKKPAMNTVCKEHEWALVGTSTKGIGEGDITYDMRCRYCGKRQPEINSIDFQISENLSQINKQEWEDIYSRFFKTKEYKTNGNFHTFQVFKEWLIKNYLAPEKKNT